MNTLNSKPKHDDLLKVFIKYIPNYLRPNDIETHKFNISNGDPQSVYVSLVSAEDDSKYIYELYYTFYDDDHQNMFLSIRSTEGKFVSKVNNISTHGDHYHFDRRIGSMVTFSSHYHDMKELLKTNYANEFKKLSLISSDDLESMLSEYIIKKASVITAENILLYQSIVQIRKILKDRFIQDKFSLKNFSSQPKHNPSKNDLIEIIKKSFSNVWYNDPKGGVIFEYYDSNNKQLSEQEYYAQYPWFMDCKEEDLQ